jgi:hypothetical protein
MQSVKSESLIFGIVSVLIFSKMSSTKIPMSEMLIIRIIISGHELANMDFKVGPKMPKNLCLSTSL